MLTNIALASLSLASAFAAQPAPAQYSTQTTITPPFYQPGAGSQMGGSPYVTPGFTAYPPGSPVTPPDPEQSGQHQPTRWVPRPA